jgi:hypothetical protein
MGRSFVKFKGHGFWTRDEYLLDWLTAALVEITKIEHVDAWKLEIGHTWDEAIMTGFPGGIDPALDKILTDQSRVQFLIDLSKKLELSTSDPKLKRFGELLIALADGKLTTTTSSPVDYW